MPAPHNQNHTVSCGRWCCRRLRSCLANSPPDSLRQAYGHEVLLRVQVVFAGLIDDANLMMLQAHFVWEDLIYLAQFQGRGIALVAYADDEMCFAFHVLEIVAEN